MPECRFPPPLRHVWTDRNKPEINLWLVLVNWAKQNTSDQTLILKSTTADRLQSEHLSVAVFFPRWGLKTSPGPVSQPCTQTCIQSSAPPLSWTHADTNEEEFDRITWTFPSGTSSFASLVWKFQEIILKSQLKLQQNKIFKEIIFEIGEFPHVKKYTLLVKHL